jgi:hypothetical protein
MLNLKIKVMKRTNVIFAASLLVVASFFAACEKSETTDPMVEASQDDDLVTALYDDALNEVDDMTVGSTTKSSALFATLPGSGSRIAVTTTSGDTIIKTITFTNFINGNSESGNIKNGVIVVKILGGPLQNQFERTLTFQNFTINGNKIEGKKQVTKTSEYQYSVMLTAGKVTFTDGTTYTRECTRTRTWAEGYNTPANIWDDTYTVEGSATGTNRLGYTYTHTITNALVIRNTCRWIVEGTIEMVANNSTATIDYGMGECDNLATITVNGATTEIALKAKR